MHRETEVTLGDQNETISDQRILPLSVEPQNARRFRNLFYDPISLQVQKKTRLSLHILRVESGDFAIEPLLKELVNMRNFYVLSRREIEEFRNDMSRWGEFNEKAEKKFRKPDSNAGEGGELLLYSILESHLGAPKLLSKMELKTDAQHYIHGSDGVHLLRNDDESYEVIFGESKMYADTKDKPGTSIRNGFQAALNSISEAQEEGFQFEFWLVQSNLLKEALEEGAIDALEEILLPPASGGPRVRKSNAFGIFVGFEIDVSDVKFSDLDPEEIEKLLLERAEHAVVGQQQWLAERIDYLDLGGFPFHIYAIPFLRRVRKGDVLGIEDIRKKSQEG